MVLDELSDSLAPFPPVISFPEALKKLDFILLPIEPKPIVDSKPPAAWAKLMAEVFYDYC